MKKYSKYIIAFICTSIVVIRIIFPKLNFDLISLSLIVIATFAMLVEKPEDVFKNTKRLNLWGAELELHDLHKSAEIIEKRIKTPKGLSGSISNYSENENSIQILRLSTKIECKVREIFEGKFIPTSDKIISFTRMLEELQEGNFIDYETVSLINGFWSFRNGFVHNNSCNINKQDFKMLNDVGYKILTILESIKDSDGGKLPHYRVN